MKTVLRYSTVLSASLAVTASSMGSITTAIVNGQYSMQINLPTQNSSPFIYLNNPELAQRTNATINGNIVIPAAGLPSYIKTNVISSVSIPFNPAYQYNSNGTILQYQYPTQDVSEYEWRFIIPTDTPFKADAITKSVKNVIGSEQKK